MKLASLVRLVTRHFSLISIIIGCTNSTEKMWFSSLSTWMNGITIGLILLILSLTISGFFLPPFRISSFSVWRRTQGDAPKRGSCYSIKCYLKSTLWSLWRLIALWRICVSTCPLRQRNHCQLKYHLLVSIKIRPSSDFELKNLEQKIWISFHWYLLGLCRILYSVW